MPPDAQIERLRSRWTASSRKAPSSIASARGIWRGAIVNAAPQAPKPARRNRLGARTVARSGAARMAARRPLRAPHLPDPQAWLAAGHSRLHRDGESRGNTRRYTYPLAHDPGGTRRSLRHGRAGARQRRAVGVTGRVLRSSGAREAISPSLGMSAQDFVPTGDLMLEYALPTGAELTTFAYPGKPKTARRTWRSRSGRSSRAERRRTAPSPSSSTRVARCSARATAARSELAVAPRARARRKRPRHGAGMRRRVPDAPGRPARSGRSTAAKRSFSTGSRPRAAPISSARSGARCASATAPSNGNDSRSHRVVYIGDGAPTVGEVRPGTVERAVARNVDRARASVTTVAVGAESDSATLAAASRGGGGVVVPYAPGRSVTGTAYAVLGATYGQALTNVEVTLPEGLRSGRPRRLDAIPAGGEAIVLARMDNLELAGDVVVKGLVGAKPFERATREARGERREWKRLRASTLRRRAHRQSRARRNVRCQAGGHRAFEPLQRREPLHLTARARERRDVQGVRARQHPPFYPVVGRGRGRHDGRPGRDRIRR